MTGQATSVERRIKRDFGVAIEGVGDFEEMRRIEDWLTRKLDGRSRTTHELIFWTSAMESH
ncbi:MAG TPA: hypothetical protein VGK93_07010 [Candidatus Eisenbacteria bacterium]|jgi:hypothetical protein